ncbi:MAG: motor neuron and pancreas homeobox protein 1 [Desulfovibrionaceae bacterium]|nr:motor neuron and pancreas homeobox protein 1 [Desulfovibrionaceae bacterium]
MRRIAVLCLACLLSGCVTPAGNLTVQALDKPEFRTMTSVLRPQLTRHGLLTEDGAWYEPVLSLAGLGLGSTAHAGATLFERLSPAFRFPGLAQDLLPGSFRGMVTGEAGVSVTAHAFTVLQGVDKVHVSLLALTDWTRDGRDDWLLLCRIEPQNQPGTRRDYYLLVDDPAAPVLKPRVLAIRDCVSGRCRIVETADDPGLAPESPAMELMQGQQTITQPPASAPAELRQGPTQTRLTQ